MMEVNAHEPSNPYNEQLWMNYLLAEDDDEAENMAVIIDYLKAHDAW